MAIMTDSVKKQLKQRLDMYKNLAELNKKSKDAFEDFLRIVYSRYVNKLEYGNEERLHDYRLVLRFVSHLKREIKNAARQVEKITYIFNEAESVGILDRYLQKLKPQKGEAAMDVLNKLKFHTKEMFDHRDNMED